MVDTAGLTAEAAGVRLRLTGTLIASPLVLASAASLTLSQAHDPVTVATANFLIFGFCWLGGLWVASHGREKLVGALSLATAALLAPLLIAAGGGLASPLAVLLFALLFEPWWVWRKTRALKLGVAAAVIAGVGAVFAGQAVQGSASAALWLPVLLYAGLLAARVSGRNTVDATTSNTNELAAAMDAVVLRITDSGDVADATGKAHELMRLPPELLLQQGLFDRVHVADRVAYLCALSDIRNGAAHRKLDVRLRLPAETDAQIAGVYEWFSAELLKLPSDETGVVAVLRKSQMLEDLSARLAASEERAEQAELSRSSFLASVSHELRTPLNAIIGFSDMLTHELYGRFTDPRQKEHVALISEAGHHLLGVVNAILDVSKIELGAYTINREPFDLSAAMATSCAMVSVQAERKGIAIDTQFDPAIGEVDADCRAVKQIMINLLSNAVKFTPEGGKVTVGAELDGQTIRLWVKDTGIGIATEDLARLGQPFVQASNDYARRAEGTGLGLALVKGLVQLHGGEFSLDSELGRGTTASVILPGSAPTTEETEHLANVQILRMDHGAFRKTA